MGELGKNIAGKGATEYVAMSNFINYSIVLLPSQFMIFSRSLELSTGASIDAALGSIVEVT